MDGNAGVIAALITAVGGIVVAVINRRPPNPRPTQEAGISSATMPKRTVKSGVANPKRIVGIGLAVVASIIIYLKECTHVSNNGGQSDNNFINVQDSTAPLDSATTTPNDFNAPAGNPAITVDSAAAVSVDTSHQ